MQWILKVLGIVRRTSALNRTVNRLQSEVERSRRDLEGHIARINILQEQVREEVASARKSVEYASAINDKLEKALDGARQENEVLTDIVIPGLVAANRTFQDSWDAQSAQFNMRTAYAQSIEEDK